MASISQGGDNRTLGSPEQHNGITWEALTKRVASLLPDGLTQERSNLANSGPP